MLGRWEILTANFRHSMRRTGRIRMVRQQTMKMSVRQRIAVVSSIVAVLTVGITIFINLSNNEKAYAAKSVGIAVANGSWSSATTWSFSGIHRVPTCNDSVIIPIGKTVTVNSQVDLAGCGSSISIMVFGTFDFTNGFKLDLPCNSYIYIMPPSGLIKKATSGGGNSTLITICSTILWAAGDGPLPGPDTLFVLGGGGSTLPVKLMYFNAKLENQNVKFDWATSAELNNEYFTIEKSNDGEHFESLLKQPGAGNSTSNLYYRAEDNSPYNGFSYYRLKQTDYDGHFTYSNIETIRNGERNEDASEGIEIKSMAPNPFSESFRLSFMMKTSATIDISLMSTAGQLVAEEKFQSESGYNTWEFIDKYNLKKGIYFVILSYNNQKFTKKIVRS
jgi:hypothetical protein